jgi:hypothetical protein
LPVTVLAATSTSLANEVAPGALGFLIVAGMAVALYFLIRSMNKQLAKVGADKRTFAQPGDPMPGALSQDSAPGPRQDS